MAVYPFAVQDTRQQSCCQPLPSSPYLSLSPQPRAASQPGHPLDQADVRSPCPGLNSLANHGFLPHDGKGMTIPILVKGLKDGLKVGADFATVIGTAGLLSVQGHALATSFNLDDLDEHNFSIEHGAILSRQEFYTRQRDNHDFNQTIFDEVLSYYNEMEETGIPVAAAAKWVFTLGREIEDVELTRGSRYDRVAVETKRDPRFTYTPQQHILSYGETALYLSTISSPTASVAPVEYVKVCFGALPPFPPFFARHWANMSNSARKTPL